MYVAIFAVLFSASCLLCCFGRFRFFVALFALVRLCLALHMQCLGKVSPATFVLFFFVLWPAGFGGVVFALAVPPPVIRPKCGSPVPMRALPCLLPVFPYIKFPHWVHPNHSRTSVRFWACVCAFFCECV